MCFDQTNTKKKKTLGRLNALSNSILRHLKVIAHHKCRKITGNNRKGFFFTNHCSHAKLRVFAYVFSWLEVRNGKSAPLMYTHARKPTSGLHIYIVIRVVGRQPAKPFNFNSGSTSTCKAWEVCKFSLSPIYYRLPPAAWAVRAQILAYVQLSSDLGLFVIWGVLSFAWAAVLEPCWNARAVLEEQREVTSPCDASNSTGQELHTEVTEIINKVVHGCCAVAGK